MNKCRVWGMLLMGVSLWSYAETAPENPDSMKIEQMNELVVKAVKAPQAAPFAVWNINRQTLAAFQRTAQELPFLFARTPGVTAWSENGMGTGTTYMRIRGAGDSRINVNIDGVSLNSPEDQCVFWANMNSYAAFLGNVQIQRGVGTSVNGDGAFGGSIALTTKSPSLLPSLELTGSAGSYGTYNVGGNFSTGLLLDHLVVDGTYHHTATDGYVHGTSGNSGSYQSGITYFNTDRTLKLSYKNIGNYERTGQAWNGVVAGNDYYSLNAYNDVYSYRDLYKLGLGKYNSLYEDFDPDKYEAGKGYTTTRKEWKGGLWKRTTDNFWQNHNLLSLVYELSPRWTTSATLRYTHGHGYYEELKTSYKLKKFGLSDFVLSNGETLEKSDFVRKKGLTQDTYGMHWNLNYKDNRWDVMAGAMFQQFEANHYGYLTYVKNEELATAILQDGRYKYYDSDARKNDQSLFIKGIYHIDAHWAAYADLQYRHVGYMTGGVNDKFYKLSDGSYANQRLDISKRYDFLNPKAGISYTSRGHKAYLSYALSHREPERNNFTDNGSYPAPKAEMLHDLELGYSYEQSRWYAGVGLYGMFYRDQFVQTGETSDIGEFLTTNIKNSYRLGVEMSAGVNVTPWLSLEGNAALSQNKIKDFDEMVETSDNNWVPQDPTIVHYNNSTLAFSPTAILNGFVDFHLNGFSATWHTNFVSRQYLDNTACKERSLPKYSQTNIALSYDLKCFRKGLKSALLGLTVNNIFDRHYAANGWVYSAIVGTDYPESNRYHQIGYIPMAGTTVMGNLTLKF